MGNNYNDILEDLDILWANHNPHDLENKIEHIKGRVIELQKQLDNEKSKALKMQVMIETLLHKLGKNVIYDALGIEEEVENDD